MANPEEMPTELSDIDTVEVSLVDKGANMRHFAIRKSEEKMSVVEAILSAPFEQADAVDAQLAKAELSAQATEGIKSAMQIMAAFEDELPGGVMQSMMDLVGATKEDEEKPEEEDEEKPAPVEQKDEDEDEMKKRMDALPDDVRSMVAQLWKSNKEEIAKRAALEDRIKKAEDEKKMEECIKKAQTEYSNIPVTAADLGSFLKGIDGSASAEFVHSMLKSTNEMLGQANITGEIGKTITGTETDAVAKAERMAEAMSEKEGITKSIALGRVWKSNPALYVEYQAQRRGQ